MASQSEIDLYALVSQAYAPGTIIAWLLIAVSILILWTIHPRKRKANTVSIDLVTVLVLPAVAAVHTIVLCARLAQSVSAKSNTSAEEFQKLAAIDAPATVVSTFNILSPALLYVASWNCLWKRVALIALVTLLSCVARFHQVILRLLYQPQLQEWVGKRNALGFRYDYGKQEETDTGWTWFALVCFLCLWLNFLRNFIRELRSPEPSPREMAMVMPLLFSPLLLISATSAWAPLDLTDTRARDMDWLPRTSASLTDLDQMLALSGGATVLGFAVYSTIKALR